MRRDTNTNESMLVTYPLSLRCNASSFIGCIGRISRAWFSLLRIVCGLQVRRQARGSSRGPASSKCCSEATDSCVRRWPHDEGCGDRGSVWKALCLRELHVFVVCPKVRSPLETQSAQNAQKQAFQSGSAPFGFFFLALLQFET